MKITSDSSQKSNPFSELEGLKEILPVYERKLVIKHNKVMPKIDKGDVIPLPCVKYDSGRWEKVFPVYTTTERGSSVVLVTVHHNFTRDGVVALRDNKKPGLVCFCNSDLPKNTIAFVVTERKERCAIVAPVTGSDEELFKTYEQELITVH